MLARRASSSFSCNKQPRYAQPRERRAWGGRPGSTGEAKDGKGSWKAAPHGPGPSPMDITPWVHTPPATGSTSVGAAGRSEAHPRHRTARHGADGTRPRAARVIPVRGAHAAKERAERRALHSTHSFIAPTRGGTRHPGTANSTPRGSRAPSTTHSHGKGHTATSTHSWPQNPRGVWAPGASSQGTKQNPKKKTAEPARSPAAVRAAELCPAPAAPGASPGCTPQPCAWPAPWHHHGPGAHCCHSIPPSSDIEHLCLLLLPEGEAAVDVAADVLVTELPQLRDQLGRLLPSLGCSSGCQPGGRRT